MEDDQEDLEPIEGSLYVNSHVIKLCLADSFGGSTPEEALSFKYTIDYPKLDLHPFDTSRFKLTYSDDRNDA